jgi:hypothetical protein
MNPWSGEEGFYGPGARGAHRNLAPVMFDAATLVRRAPSPLTQLILR